MELEDIKAIIELMKANDLSAFELERNGEKLKIERGGFTPAPQLLPTTVGSTNSLSPVPQDSAISAGSTSAPAPGKEITSPMVGTFYSAASPEAPPFVAVGQEVDEETVVCIIEAMKVMNEIKAECRGVIAEVVAENGKPVQFGQTLFRLK